MASPPLLHSSIPDPTRLAPDDAYYHPHPHPRRSSSSSNRRRRTPFKKLLWFKQPFPDNYTDEETFLDHLQRNPRLQPYQFWSLMADSTVIVQHIASVAIFCCAFVAIFLERVEPVVVVKWASGGTVAGWVLWDYWIGMELAAEDAIDGEGGIGSGSIVSGAGNEEEDQGGALSASSREKDCQELNLAISKPSSTASTHSHSPSTSSIVTNTSESSKSIVDADGHGSSSNQPAYMDPSSSLSPRNQQRLATAKSALLIYAALLGLSPILKSLTRSTTSDSIWALSTWLLMMNVAFFDYGSDATSHLPASISTNSALMASTVLASRLPSTTHVFSLTLFSIEVFGLFPIFRRRLRSVSWTGHLILTIVLVVNACGFVFVTLTDGGRAAWIAGVILGSILTFLAMGICSWRLIGLQKYKNEIHGPWDPARPVIRRRWD